MEWNPKATIRQVKVRLGLLRYKSPGNESDVFALDWVPSGRWTTRSSPGQEHLNYLLVSCHDLWQKIEALMWKNNEAGEKESVYISGSPHKLFLPLLTWSRWVHEVQILVTLWTNDWNLRGLLNREEDSWGVNNKADGQRWKKSFLNLMPEESGS